MTDESEDLLDNLSQQYALIESLNGFVGNLAQGIQNPNAGSLSKLRSEKSGAKRDSPTRQGKQTTLAKESITKEKTPAGLVGSSPLQKGSNEQRIGDFANRKRVIGQFASPQNKRNSTFNGRASIAFFGGGRKPEGLAQHRTSYVVSKDNILRVQTPFSNLRNVQNDLAHNNALLDRRFQFEEYLEQLSEKLNEYEI